jgi:hypothetical protein
MHGKRLLLGGAAMVAVRESRSDTRTVIYGFLGGRSLCFGR